jgi:3-deoxy-D-manno-octulosonic-acid transferase
VPLLMADAAAPAVAGGGWWPGLLRRSLGAFAEVLARDTAALVALRRAGADPARLHVGGALVEIGRALPCTEAERAALARAVGTRPSWLAVGVPAAEDARVAAAHQAALRMTHRLLLFVVPDDANRAEAVAAAMAAEGLTVARRSLDQDIDDDTHVYLADTEGELGLWYRLAPVAYFGGTLSGEAGVRHPFEAAALGAAILRGPASGGLGAHGPLWDDLRAAGACRLVRDADDLGEAVGDLLAPDRAAAMARAGWEASSAGTVAAERVMAMLDAVLGPPPAPDPGAEAGAPARRRRRREA